MVELQIKSENNCVKNREHKKYRKSFKGEKNLEWKNLAKQDEPLDTKDEIKKDESKIR